PSLVAGRAAFGTSSGTRSSSAKSGPEMTDAAFVTASPSGVIMIAWKFTGGSANGGSRSVMLKVCGKPGSAVGTSGAGPNRPTPSTIVPPSGSTPRIGSATAQVGQNRPTNGFTT